MIVYLNDIIIIKKNITFYLALFDTSALIFYLDVEAIKDGLFHLEKNP